MSSRQRSTMVELVDRARYAAKVDLSLKGSRALVHAFLSELEKEARTAQQIQTPLGTFRYVERGGGSVRAPNGGLYEVKPRRALTFLARPQLRKLGL